MKVWQPTTLDEAQALYQASIIQGVQQMAQASLERAVDELLSTSAADTALLTAAHARANTAREVRDALIAAPQVYVQMRQAVQAGTEEIR